MTVASLLEHGFIPLNISDGEREIDGVYIGDLLSWVMGRAEQDNAWVTIMSNINTLAVASLADVSCIILAEGVELDNEVLCAAKEKQINVLAYKEPAYETAVKLSALLS